MNQKEQIIHESYRLFLRYGIKRLTMEDLSKGCGKSKKTVYKHFRNKESLVKSVIQHFVDEQKNILERCRKNAGNAIEELAGIYEHNINALTELRPALGEDLQLYYQNTWKIFDDYKNKFLLEFVKTNLNNGIKEGLFRDDLDVEVIARHYTSKVERIRDEAVFPQSEFSLKRVLKSIFYYHIRGIASKKGLDYIENDLVVRF